jgi:hypothetical protein
MNTIKLTSINLIFSFLVFLSSCGLDPDSFQPTATISGAIRDSLDNSLVEQDLFDGSKIEALEQGYTAPYFWAIMNNGEYRNNFGFPNTYSIRFANCNFFPFSIDDVLIKKGDNVIDFQVVPYIRVKEPEIAYDANSKMVTATFKLEPGKPAVRVKSIELFAFSDRHVGAPIKFAISGGGNMKFLNTTIDSTVTYTLTVDVSKNLVANKFYEGGNFYFRIGAQADVPDVGTIRHNYAPYVKIKI